MKTFWVSMAPPEPPARVVLLDAEDAVLARVKMHAMKLYQRGDQVLILEIPEHMPEHKLPRNRVLTREELDSVNASTIGEAIATGRWPTEQE